MLNINIITPNQIPHRAGLIGFVNANGDIGSMSATRGTGEMRYDLDKANRKKELVKSGIYDDRWRNTSQEKRVFFCNYPESIYRVVFWAMDYELADSLRRKFTKNELLFSDMGGLIDSFNQIKQDKINALQMQIEKLKQIA